MKRILICVLLVLLCVGCLFACDKKKDKTTTAATTTVPSTPAVTTTVPPAQTTTTVPRTPTTTTTVPQVPTTTVDPTIPDPSNCTHTANTNPLLCEDEVTCSVCGDAIGAVGHVYAPSGDHVDGNCKTPGHQAFTCLLCGHSFQEMDSENGLHQYAGGVCTVCNTSAGTTKIEQTDADIVIMPDRYNTGAGSLMYRNEEIIPVTKSGVYNGFQVNVGGSINVSLKGMDPQNNEIVIRNLDFTAGGANLGIKFTGVADYGTLTEKTTVRFVNCIFGQIYTNRDGDSNKMYLYFDHCTVENFGGSNVVLDWCYFGGQDDTDAINPFQNVTAKNCLVADKGALGYEKELHTDAVQIYGYGPGNPTIVAKNQLYYNFRAEMPSIWYTDSFSYTNSALMISLDYNDADNITFQHCYINGCGVPIMVFDNPHTPAGTFKMTNILYTDIKYGCAMQYRIEGAFKLTHPESDVTIEWDGDDKTIVSTGSLFLGSVWVDGGKTHFSVTNDTNQKREFTVFSDKGTFSFFVEPCPFFVEFEIDMAYTDFPFDVEYTVDEELTWAVCYDSTNGVFQQIRFYNPTDAEVELDNSLFYGWTSHAEYYEVAHGRMGVDIYWELYSDGTLYIVPTNNEQGPGNRSKTSNTPKSDFSAYKSMVTKIVVKPGVTAITNGMFKGMSGVTSVVLPSTLKTIGANAFQDCRSLESINLPYGLTTLDRNAFLNCYSLTSIVIPSTVKSLGARVFSGCVSLESAKVAAAVRALPASLFYGCYALEEVYLSGTVASFGDRDVFGMCQNLKRVYYAGSEETFALIGDSVENVRKHSHFFFAAERTLITSADLVAFEDRDLANREPQPTTLTKPAISKVYDGTPVAYVPETNSDGAVTLKWMHGTVDIGQAPTEVGRYQLVVKIAETENHQAFFGSYTFYIYEAKASVEILSESLDKAYDGKPVAEPEYEVVSDGQVSIVWKSGDAVCEETPYLPGVYTLTVSVPKTANYSAASKSMTVTIREPNGVTCWDGTAATAFAGGAGTEEAPYLIATAEQLAYLASLVNNASTNEQYGSAYYRLTSDIFLNEGASTYPGWVSADSKAPWTAIGLTEATPFSGHFDGAGFTVFGMDSGSSTVADHYAGGLFGVLNGAVVENLSIRCSVSAYGGAAKTATGMVASYAIDSTIRNITVRDCIVFGKHNSAAIVGQIKMVNKEVVIDNCYADAKVYSTANSLSGFAGIVGKVLSHSNRDLTYRILNCTFRGSVSTSQRAAGIVGTADTNVDILIRNCTNYATITATGTGGYAAGIITSLSTTAGGYDATIENCLNFGEINAAGGNYAAGIMATAGMKNSKLSIQNVANYGTVSVKGTHAAGILASLGGAADNSRVVINNAISAADVTAANYAGAVIGQVQNDHSVFTLSNIYYRDTDYATSAGAIDGTVAVKSIKSDSLLNVLNAEAALYETYLTWTQGERGPRFIGKLQMDSESLDRIVDGKPADAPLYTKLQGDGLVRIVWYCGDTVLDGAPTEAGDYRVVVVLAETLGFTGHSVQLDVVLATAGEASLRINSLDKIYDGVAVTDPVINTTNEGAAVTYTYYKGAIGQGTKLDAAPTEAGTYYVVVSVAATSDYGAITKEKAFVIDKAPGVISNFDDPSREYNGAAISVEGFTYNGTVAVTVEYYKGTYDNRGEKLESAPTELGRYVVILTAEAEANFTGVVAYQNFEILPITTSVTIDSAMGKPHDGTPVAAPAYTATESGGAVSIIWKDAEGNVLAEAPSAAGSYTVTVSLAANGNYAGASSTVAFDIWKTGQVWSGELAASFSGGTGTESDPFLISTAEQLAYMAYLINSGARYTVTESGNVTEGGVNSYGTAFYKLIADIVLNENSSDYKTWATFDRAAYKVTPNAPANLFTCIGQTASYAFSGTLDGAGYSIIGLYVYGNGGTETGLFGHVIDGTIKNLTIKESVFYNAHKSYNAGAVIANAQRATISNCHVKDVLVYSIGSAGGFVGIAGKTAKDLVTVENSSFEGEVCAAVCGSGVVGITNVHSAHFTVRGTTVRGEIYAKDLAAGFINTKQINPIFTVENCTNYATITSVTSTAGGILSRLHYSTGGDTSRFKNVANHGAVTGATYAGGIIGAREMNSNQARGILYLENILNTGLVTATGETGIAGGIIGIVPSDGTHHLINVVSTATPKGAVVGTIFGSVGDRASVYVNTTAVYALDGTVGAGALADEVKALITVATAEQLAGTATIDGKTLVELLNANITEDNGYKTWAIEDGKLILK